MSKIRYFSWGKYKYFNHCPFCGSVEVDFNSKTFSCPECGAVVTFELPKRKPVFDGATDEEIMINLWNNREGYEDTADDMCIKAQRASKEELWKRVIDDKVMDLISASADLGKYECEVPIEFIDNPEEYKEKRFGIEKKDSSYIISWRKDLIWD